MPSTNLFSAPPKAGAKKCVPMFSVRDTGLWTEHTEHCRPKDKIVAKNNRSGTCKTLSLITENTLVAGYGRKYITDDDMSAIYRLPDFEEVDTIVGIGNELDMSPSKRYLVGKTEIPESDAPFGVGIATIQPLRIESKISAYGPSTWRNDNELIVGVWDWFRPQQVNEENKYLLAAVTNRPAGVTPLLKIDHNAGSVSVIYELEFGKQDSLKKIQLDSRAETLYYASQRRIGAVDIETGVLKWEIQLAGSPSGVHDVYDIYGFAISHDGQYLAAGGIASQEHRQRNFVVLDTVGGSEVLKSAFPLQLEDSPLKAKTSVSSICWHAMGWLAIGTSAGVIVHMLLDGSFRAYRGSTKGISALTFIDNQKLLVASGEKQFRVWDLLPDEYQEVH